jgi:tRNA (guanine-N7-)-methyltransferase
MNRYKKKITLKNEAQKYILKADSKGVEQADFTVIFGNDHPVEIEAGFGTGRFIVEYSRRNPAVNLLGIEITRKMVHHVANRLYNEKLGNVKLVHCDVRPFIGEKVKTGSIQKVHVYFPDPWPKKRHIKRRIINEDFLIHVHRVLNRGGQFSLFTDCKDYFDYFLAHQKSINRFEVEGDPGDYTPTSYELKWLKQGRRIYRSILKKT